MRYPTGLKHFALPLILIQLSGCVNSRVDPSYSKSSSTSSSATSTLGTTSSGTSGVSTGTTASKVAQDQFKITNVTFTSAATSTPTPTATPTTTTAVKPPVASVYFDLSQSTSASGSSTQPRIDNYCQSASSSSSSSSSRGCVCQFIWTEINSSTGTNYTLQRQVQTAVTIAQSSIVQCSAPDVYLSEIADGTQIKVTVLPATSNSSLFTVLPFTATKSGTQQIGSFLDIQGQTLKTISHYSCFEQFYRGSDVKNLVDSAQQSTTNEQTTYPIANKFCIQKAGSAGAADAKCPVQNIDFSSEAYYYNFYVKSEEMGAINSQNTRYRCPLVKEALFNPSGSPQGEGRYWPLDSTFSLSQGKTKDFTVPIEAFSGLAIGGGDPLSANAKTCSGTVPASNSGTNGFIQSCLGFAAKPSTDGTCPSFSTSTGVVQTYRLRRFIAIYPHIFDSDGSIPKTPQRSDTVYVLDRPVQPPTGADPRKAFTMRGPKPCPFALFDHNKVLQTSDGNYPDGSRPTYAGTNDSRWSGTNVDGIHFPNADSENSCSTALALPQFSTSDSSQAVVSLGTLNIKNPVLKRQYVRPMVAWSPHFEEDTEFLACAPQATPFLDPPLHFAKDPHTGNVSWCASSYPTQNHNVGSLDSPLDPKKSPSSSNPYIGHVRPFTSPVVKNSLSAECTATVPDSVTNGSSYPAASASASCLATANPTAIARHPIYAFVDYKDGSAVCANKTCDRTTMPFGDQPGWTKFPLQARPQDIETTISSDTTYGCTVTWDNGGSKTGKYTPTGGCCGDTVILKTGLSTSSSDADAIKNMNAHLEPDQPCRIPKY